VADDSVVASAEVHVVGQERVGEACAGEADRGSFLLQMDAEQLDLVAAYKDFLDTVADHVVQAFLVHLDQILCLEVVVGWGEANQIGIGAFRILGLFNERRKPRFESNVQACGYHGQAEALF